MKSFEWSPLSFEDPILLTEEERSSARVSASEDELKTIERFEEEEFNIKNRKLQEIAQEIRTCGADSMSQVKVMQRIAEII